MIWSENFHFEHTINWKFSLQTIFGSKPLKHTVNWKYFPENLFSMRNQTPAFMEKHFESDLKPKQT